MKKPTPVPRASHVNNGTSVSPDELPWPRRTDVPVIALPKLHAEVDDRAPYTPYGGLALFADVCRRLDVPRVLDEHVHVLKAYLPYHESDHILAQAASLYVGATCIEDMMYIQKDEAVLRMLGACRTPDPTTAGDFLRRFDDGDNPGSLAELRGAIDEIQSRAWRRIAKKTRRRRKGSVAVVDLDGHIKELCGAQFEDADFSYNGKWSFNALVMSLRGTGECVAVRLRPGNVRSSDGAAELLRETLPRLFERFEHVLVRADSDFDRRDVRDACDEFGAYFAFVGRETTNRPEIASQIDEWRPFRTRRSRERAQSRHRKGYRSRPGAHKGNRRKQQAWRRGYKDLQLVTQWVGETEVTPGRQQEPLRLVVRKQLINSSQLGQQILFLEERYRYVVTNLPRSWSSASVIDETYQRCDQENVIEQLGSGIAMWRMPVKEFAGNEAWLEIARLAWNMRSWIAQLSLPEEVVRWEWKRFRQAFVYVAAQVVRRSRQVWVRFAGSHRFVQLLAEAHARL